MTRYSHTIRAFYARLLKAGKAKKVALTACMHMPLLALHVVVRTRTP